MLRKEREAETVANVNVTCIIAARGLRRSVRSTCVEKRKVSCQLNCAKLWMLISPLPGQNTIVKEEADKHLFKKRLGLRSMKLKIFYYHQSLQ
jgi:hypothetical protein